MASGTCISVDVGALEALIGRINVARASLVSDTGMFSDGTNGIEHSVLRGSLNKFEENWSDRRREIEEALTSTRRALRSVAESFEDADRRLADEVQRRDAVVDRIDYHPKPIGGGVDRLDPVATRVQGETL